MRLLVLSDLHREHWREHAPKIDISTSQPDAVVLAGDIDKWARAIPWAAKHFEKVPVVYIAGNHEFYQSDLDKVLVELRSAASETKNVHFLDCDEFCHMGVRFLGASLWTDFKLFGDHRSEAAMRESGLAMNDYQAIRLASQNNRQLLPEDTAMIHAKHRAWIDAKLTEPFNGKTVVVTHMAPSFRSIHSRYQDDIVSSNFASNLDHLVSRADIWIHGHVHSSFQYEIGNCQVIANPCGYQTHGGRPENIDFDPNFIVEI